MSLSYGIDMAGEDEDVKVIIKNCLCYFLLVLGLVEVTMHVTCYRILIVLV